MLVIEMLGALCIAMVLLTIFSSRYRKNESWGGMAIFFMLIFLATRAGRLRVPPFGPVLPGVAWLPFVFVGFIMALVLAASVPSGGSTSTPSDDVTNVRVAREADPVPGVFVWILLAIFLIALIVRYAVIM